MREKISKIKSVEEESYRIIEAAKNEANALIETAKQQSRQILETAAIESQKEARSLVQSEEESISRQVKELQKQSISDEDALKKTASAKISKAKEYVIKEVLEHYKD